MATAISTQGIREHLLQMPTVGRWTIARERSTNKGKLSIDSAGEYGRVPITITRMWADA